MEMRLGERHGATPGAGDGEGLDGDIDAAGEGTEDLKQKWGFTPGAEDTLDVSHGGSIKGIYEYWSYTLKVTPTEVVLDLDMILGKQALAYALVVHQLRPPSSWRCDV